jgi:hypothetical protein
MVPSRVGWLLAALPAVSARKIGTTDPISEIFSIFFTLTGLCLLLLGLFLYLRQRGLLQRLQNWLTQWYRLATGEALE